MGTAFDINATTRVRTYASAGVSFLPNNRRTSQHSFVGALSSVTSFNATTEGPSAIGRLNLGVQVFNKDGLELSAEYGLQTGNSYRSQNVSGRLAYRF
jgi:hypothetical protein